MPVTTAQALRDPPVPASAAGLVALADRCVQCGLCLPHCPTYRLDREEPESPRGRIAYVRAVASGMLAPTDAGDLHLDHCLGCRRCEPVCPAGVRYGELLVAARAAQASRRDRPWRARLALALVARPALLDRLLGAYRSLAWLLPAHRRPLPRPPAASTPLPGDEPSRSPFSRGPAGVAPVAACHAPVEGLDPGPTVFVGCIARRYEGAAREALLRLLSAAGVEATLRDGQGCCGALAAHAGAATDAARLGQANRDAFAGAGTVLCLASGCHATLAGSLAGAATVADPLAVLDRLGDRLRFRPARGGRVALHLPCTQRSVVGSGPALRRLLARIPGLDLVELADTGCCGAAGLHQVAEPARAAAFRTPLLQALAASGAGEVLSANIGCRLHLGTGTTLPVRHPLEFLAEHLA